MPRIAEVPKAHGGFGDIMEEASRTSETYDNDAEIEAMWAIKAMDHAEVYFNILCSADPALLRLTSVDDEIYTDFRQVFPKLKIDVINEDELKSNSAKEIWRPFCEKYKQCVEDFSFGTLLRLDSSSEYSRENSCLVPRIQFLAIELARNREGLNSQLRQKYKTKNEVVQ